MVGALKCLFSLLGVSGHGDKKERVMLQLQTVELKVRMDCERCEHQVKKALSSMRGVQQVEVNRSQQKVTVTGNADPHKVLRKAQCTAKKAEMWPQNPHYTVVAHGHRAQAYDKWVPVGCGRNLEPNGAEQLTNLFSDDNPNACSIM